MIVIESKDPYWTRQTMIKPFEGIYTKRPTIFQHSSSWHRGAQYLYSSKCTVCRKWSILSDRETWGQSLSQSQSSKTYHLSSSLVIGLLVVSCASWSLISSKFNPAFIEIVFSVEFVVISVFCFVVSFQPTEIFSLNQLTM